VAIAAMKWAHRAVNLATCEKGPVVCEDVTDCGTGGGTVSSRCCPDPLPRTVHAVVNIDDGSFGLVNFPVNLIYDPAGFPGDEWWTNGSFCGGGGLSKPAGTACMVAIGGGYFLAALLLCSESSFSPPCRGFFVGFSVWLQGGDGSFTHVFSRGWFVNDGQAEAGCACSPLSVTHTWPAAGGVSQAEMTVTG
jgi:hypothetical protein